MISQLRQHRSQDLKAKVFFVSKAVGASLDHPNLVVEPLDKSQRHFVLWPTVSGNAIPMPLDHLGKFLMRSKTFPFERCLPVIKNAPGPSFSLIASQLFKGLLGQIGGVEPLISTEQSFQRLEAFKTQVLPARHQRVFLPLDEASVLTGKSPVLTFASRSA